MHQDHPIELSQTLERSSVGEEHVHDTPVTQGTGEVSSEGNPTLVLLHS